jgi:hypothetical protein
MQASSNSSLLYQIHPRLARKKVDEKQRIKKRIASAIPSRYDYF